MRNTHTRIQHARIQLSHSRQCSRRLVPGRVPGPGSRSPACRRWLSRRRRATRSVVSSQYWAADRGWGSIGANCWFLRRTGSLRMTAHSATQNTCDIVVITVMLLAACDFRMFFYFAEFYNFVLFVFDHCHGTKPHWLYIYICCVDSTHKLPV